MLVGLQLDDDHLDGFLPHATGHQGLVTFVSELFLSALDGVRQTQLLPNQAVFEYDVLSSEREMDLIEHLN